MGDFSRVLITGGAGFIGSHLCARFLDDGAEVICVDNLATGSRTNIDALIDHPGFTWIDHDVAGDAPIPRCASVDLVAHLACPPSPAYYLTHRIDTLRCGADGTRHALDTARAHGARFLLASTSEVYGDPQEHPQSESYWGHVNPVGPRSVYDESKRYGEALTVAYRADGVDTAIARIFNTYGPRMRADDGRMIPTFIGQALRGEPMTVTGSGQQTRSLCYVDDLVRGLTLLAGSQMAGPVNLGNPGEMTVTDVAHTVADIVGVPRRIAFVPAMTDDPVRRCPDISLAQTTLGWTPQTRLDDGLRRTVRWYTRPSSAVRPTAHTTVTATAT